MIVVRGVVIALCIGLVGLHARAAEPATAIASAASAAVRSPEQVVHDFYAWYLGQLAKDQDPLTLKSPQLADFVSAALLAEIDRKVKSADGLDADYFLKTQDYLDGWLANVAVGPAKVAGASATAMVTLGAPGGARDEIWKLRVTLTSGADKRWKIRSVAKA